jgi:hypothetical protein
MSKDYLDVTPANIYDGKELIYLSLTDDGQVIRSNEETGVKCALQWEIDEFPYIPGEYTNDPGGADLYVDRKHGFILYDKGGYAYNQEFTFEIGGYDFSAEAQDRNRFYDYLYERSSANGQVGGYTVWNGRRLRSGQNIEDIEEAAGYMVKFPPVSTAHFEAMNEDTENIGVYTDAPFAFVRDYASAIVEKLESILQKWEDTHCGSAEILAKDLPTMGRNEYRYFVPEYDVFDAAESKEQAAEWMATEYKMAEDLNSGRENLLICKVEILPDGEEDEEFPVGENFSYSVYSGGDRDDVATAAAEAVAEAVAELAETVAEVLTGREEAFGALA